MAALLRRGTSPPSPGGKKGTNESDDWVQHHHGGLSMAPFLRREESAGARHWSPLYHGIDTIALAATWTKAIGAHNWLNGVFICDPIERLGLGRCWVIKERIIWYSCHQFADLCCALFRCQVAWGRTRSRVFGRTGCWSSSRTGCLTFSRTGYWTGCWTLGRQCSMAQCGVWGRNRTIVAGSCANVIIAGWDLALWTFGARGSRAQAGAADDVPAAGFAGLGTLGALGRGRLAEMISKDFVAASTTVEFLWMGTECQNCMSENLSENCLMKSHK